MIDVMYRAIAFIAGDRFLFLAPTEKACLRPTSGLRNILVLLSVLCGVSSVYAHEGVSGSVTLADEERTWLDQNPEKLTLFFNPEFPPIEFSSCAGDFVGMGADIAAKNVKTMGYPFGRANDRVVEAARKAGYTHGFTMAFPDETDNPLTTGRYAVYTFDSQRSIVRRLQRGPLFGLERAKARMSNTLSLGTVLLNRLRRTE